MTIQLTTRQGLALRKTSAQLLRKHGITDPEKYSVHGLDWRGLNDLEADVKREANAVLDKMSESASDDQVRSANEAHEGLMQIFDAVSREKDIRSNIGDRGPRSTDMNPMVPMGSDVSVRGVDDGYSYSAAREASTSLRSNESFVNWVTGNRRGDLRDYRGLTTGDFLKAMIVGPSNDMEKRALSEGTDSAGGYTVPDVLSARLIDHMRSASVVMKAGAQTIPLSSDVNYIAKLLTDPAPAWRAENAAIAESDPTFGRVTLTARSLGVIVKVSRELLEDTLNIGTALPNIIAVAMAAELDRVALLGSGTAPEPRGVANFSGLTSNTFAGGALTAYRDLMLARRALMGANVQLNGFIMHSRDESSIVSTLDGNGQPVLPPPVLETVPMHISNKIPTNGGVGTNESSIFAGDWTKLLIGIRHNIRIEVLKERYATENQYAFVAVLRADVAAEHEAAFTVLEGITP